MVTGQTLDVVSRGRRPPAVPSSGTSLVTIYFRPDAYYVSVNIRTTSGLWIAPGESAATVARDVSEEGLGTTVLGQLHRPARIVVHPAQAEWPAYRRASLEPLLRQAGVSSWRAFMTETAMVDIEREGSRVTVTSMRPDRQRSDVWVPAPDGVIVLDPPEAAALGAVVVQSVGSAGV